MVLTLGKFPMWKINILCVVIFSLLIPSTCGDKQALCDVTAWHTGFVNHIKNNGINLSGWQASSLRKIRYFTEEYGDIKVMRPCSLLENFHHYILEEKDDEQPDFNEFDIKYYRPTNVQINSGEKKTEKEHAQLHINISEELEADKDESLISEGRYTNFDDVTNGNAPLEVPNDETFVPGQQNEGDNPVRPDVDPTDLSILEDEDDDVDPRQNYGTDNSDNSESYYLNQGSHKADTDLLHYNIIPDDQNDIAAIEADTHEKDETTCSFKYLDLYNMHGLRKSHNSMVPLSTNEMHNKFDDEEMVSVSDENETNLDNHRNQGENESKSKLSEHESEKRSGSGSCDHGVTSHNSDNNNDNEQETTPDLKENHNEAYWVSDEKSDAIKQEEANKSKEDRGENVMEKEKISNPLNTIELHSFIAGHERQTKQKIDNLELTLVKLENTFLTQSSNAKDDMISIQHLENKLLKLENKLYQLNQSYNHLQREHSTLKRKQREQISSIKSYRTKIKPCPTDQPKTENNFQLITRQKSRIWELSQVVANQSMNIQQIQSRSSILEEQNRQLFKMIMDQAALIATILSQVQEIGKHGAKEKLGTDELRALLNFVLSTGNKGKFYSDNGIDDENNHLPRKTVPDSAFLPLESPGPPGNYGVNSQNLAKENREISKEKPHDSFNNGRTFMVKGDVKEDDALINEQLSIEDNLKTQDNDSANVPSADTKGQTQVKNPKMSANNEERDRHSKGKVDERKHMEHRIIYPPLGDNPADCYDLYKKEGVERRTAKVFIAGLDSSVNVYCDDEGWTVLLKREGGRENFYKDFENYKEGFGFPRSEHYIGNKVVHYLSNQKHYSLRVDLTDWEGNTRHALYDNFWVDDEKEHFKLHVHGYSGTAGDGLAKHSGMKFSTYDLDNDLLKKEMGGSCAKRFKGAGWYYKCYQSNLMGLYYKDGIIPDKLFDGITWKPWKGPSYSMKFVTVSIRPREVV